MKRISIYTLALLFFVPFACTEVSEDIISTEEGQDGDYIVISAQTESDAPETKTYLGALSGSTYPVYWSENDKMGLISENGVSEFTLTKDSSDGTHATFGGNASKMVGKFPQTLIYPAAYPADGAFAAVVSDVVKVGTVLPTIQTLVNNLNGDTRAFDNDTFPMAAASISPTEYQFYNLAGILRLKIYYSHTDPTDVAGILRITLKGNDGEVLSGPVAMEFNPEDGTPIASTAVKDHAKAVGEYGTSGKEKVIIDLSACTREVNEEDKPGLQLPDNEAGALEVNLVVIPQTFEHGFTIEIMDASTMGTQVYKVNDAITIERSMIKEMEAIDYVKPAPLEVANCYPVSEPGEVMMPAFAFGNRMGTNLSTLYGEENAEKLDVDILWTDIVDGSGNKLDAITEIEYMKFADGNNYVSYYVNEDPSTGEAYRGNVVLALYNKETMQIYWTWHIWLTEGLQDVHIDGKCAKGSFTGVYPDGTPYEYLAYATNESMQILDRNLGAIHALPEECDEVGGVRQVWQTYGLYYQDGRRDPFIGGNYNGTWNVTDETSYNDDEYQKKLHRYETTAFGDGTHATWTNPMFGDERGWKFVSGVLTIDQTLNTPQKLSYNASLGQWVNYALGDNLKWMDSEAYTTGTHGRTGLLYGDHEAYWNRTKTIFDPCPPGYSVLGERGGYFIGGAGNKQWFGDDTNGYGLRYSYNGETIWWPAAGVRTIDGTMAGVGKYGFYFFYDHIDADHGGHGFGFSISGATSGSFFKNTPNSDMVLTNHATPIRCVKAIQDHGSPTLADPKKK